jgi:hypothetical protein
LSFLHRHLSYVDPPDNSFKFTARPSGRLNFDHQSRGKIYYEYGGIGFNRPKEGWLVESASLEQFLGTEILTTLDFTPKEKKDLLTEVKTSLIGKQIKKYVYLGFVSSEEITEKLPLEINPRPDNFHRTHLYLEFLNRPIEVEGSDLRPLDRGGFTVIELGVYVQE